MKNHIKVKTNSKISTKDKHGKENGFLIPIINVHDNFVAEEQWPKQVYCTVVKPGEVKGPHRHHKWWVLLHALGEM